ncbi:lysylphosphatidylglycerol synthase transmembrane domain-containing protein [Knoellia sp. CPCC 206453]|uniref:lysylphosphatidylglycerol synthase transmembrane domain-containing protein n=1 Tax=Knoellia pratensis TaxID=3404796 RepID=UPI003623D713
MSTRTKQVIRVVLGLGLAVALLGWGFPRFAKTTWGDVMDDILMVSAWNAVGFLGLVLVGLGCYTFTFTGSLPGLSHWRAFIVNICGSSVSNLLPGGGAVGLAATYTILRSWGFKNRDVSTSAIVTGVWNTLARIALPIVAIIMLWVGNDGLPKALTSAAIAATISGLAIFAAFVAILASEKSARTIGRGLDKLLAPLFRRRKRTMSIDALVRDMRLRINEVVRTGWLQMTLGMIGFFGFYYLLFVLIMHSVNVYLPLGILFAAFAIGRLLTAVAVTPGGVGVTEIASVSALVGWGADSAAAGAGIVLFSIFTHLMEVPLGALGWLAWSMSPRVENATGEDEDPVTDEAAVTAR